MKVLSRGGAFAAVGSLLEVGCYCLSDESLLLIRSTFYTPSSNKSHSRLVH